MAKAARVYVTSSSPGDLIACKSLAEELLDEVARLDGGGKSIYVHWKTLESDDEVRDEFLEQVAIERVAAATCTVFPILRINFTYNPDELRVENFTEVERKFGLILIKSGVLLHRPWT